MRHPADRQAKVAVRVAEMPAPEVSRLPEQLIAIGLIGLGVIGALSVG
jgi:hypothetical protein